MGEVLAASQVGSPGWLIKLGMGKSRIGHNPTLIQRALPVMLRPMARVVSNRLTAQYEYGPCKSWIKVRNANSAAYLLALPREARECSRFNHLHDDLGKNTSIETHNISIATRIDGKSGL